MHFSSPFKEQQICSYGPADYTETHGEITEALSHTCLHGMFASAAFSCFDPAYELEIVLKVRIYQVLGLTNGP